MPKSFNPRQMALAFLDGENFSSEDYFEGWDFNNSVSGISAATFDEDGNSRLFQCSRLDCFNRDSSEIDGDTLFNIASMTKMMTAATILRMMESEDFASYFPDKLQTKLSHFYDFIESRYPEMDYVKTRLRGENEEITLEHLLTHTSGIPDMNVKNITPDELRQFRSEEGMADGKFLDPITSRKEPGKFEYSDIGYELLGMVISAVATEQSRKNDGDIVSCQNMMKEMVINKLGMTNTFTPDQISLQNDQAVVTDFPERKIARGFVYNDDGLSETRNFLRCISCAAVYSTPSEMCKFVKALFSDKTFANGGLFEQESTISLHNSARVEQFENGVHVRNAVGDYYYGIGFKFIETPDGNKIKYHTGATIGFPGWSGCKDGKAVSCLMNSQGLTPNFSKPILQMEKEKLEAEGTPPLSYEEEHLRFCKINERLLRSYNKETLLGALNDIKSAAGDKEVLLREYCKDLYTNSSVVDQEATNLAGQSLQMERK